MKQVFAVIFLFGLMIGAILVFGEKKQSDNQTFLRIHIRANSNMEEDQNIKYMVKDTLVAYLTPRIAEGTTIEKAKDIVKSELLNLETITNKVLGENKYPYTSKAVLNNEAFPTRAYDGMVLESGYYDALVVNLGTGEGDNWWCVVYPPLCFVGEENGQVVYKSKLVEIIEDFKKKFFS